MAEPTRIAVVHPEPQDEWLGRIAVIRPPEAWRIGVVVLHERQWNKLESERFEEDLSHLADILGLPVVHEHRVAP